VLKNTTWVTLVHMVGGPNHRPNPNPSLTLTLTLNLTLTRP
jgi:hypothetical protein